MSDVLGSVRDAAGLLRRNPRAAAILAVGAVAATVVERGFAWQLDAGTTLGGVVVLLYVVGALGVLAENRRESGVLRTFGRTVRQRYLTMLGAMLASFFLIAGAGVVVFALAWVTNGFSGTALPGIDLDYGFEVGVPYPGAITGSDVAGAGTTFVLRNLSPQLGLLIAVEFIALAVLQFVDAAVVVDGEDAGAAIGKSWRLFAAKPVSTTAYALVRIAAIAATIGFPSVLGAALALSGGDATAASIGGSLPVVSAVSALVLTPIGYLVVLSYHVAYYERRTGSDGPPSAVDDPEPGDDLDPGSGDHSTSSRGSGSSTGS